MKSIITLTIVIIFSITGFAQNYSDALLLSEPGLYSSARALGMGNSYTALGNDYSSVVFNPAGLGLAKKMGLSIGFNMNSFGNSATFFDNTSNPSQSTFNFTQLGFVFPVPTVQGSLVFALGYSRNKEFNSLAEFNGFNNSNTSMIRYLTGDYNAEIPITNDLGLAYEIRDSQGNYIRDTTLVNGLLNQSGDIKAKGRISNWSFAAAMEVAKDLFVGATLGILSGNYKRDRNYYEDDTQNNYTGNLIPGDQTTNDFQSFYLNDIINWDLSGWDFKLGILYNWKDFFKFGADIKFPSHFTIKESYYISATSDFGSGTSYMIDPVVDDVEYKIQTPYEYSIGASIKERMVSVSAGIRMIDYSQMEFTDGFDKQYRIEKNAEIDDLFRLAPNYNIGAEVELPKLPLTVRIGGMYIKSPYADDPTEFDKKYLTAGFGVMLGENMRIDLGFAHGWWKDVIDNYDSQVSRIQQDISVNNLILNVSTGIN